MMPKNALRSLVLVVGCMPLLLIIFQIAVLFTYTRHATKLSYWLLKSYDVFPHGRQKKLKLIQLSSEQNGTENFPVHVTTRMLTSFSAPFRSRPRKIFCKWKSTFNLCMMHSETLLTRDEASRAITKQHS